MLGPCLKGRIEQDGTTGFLEPAAPGWMPDTRDVLGIAGAHGLPWMCSGGASVPASQRGLARAFHGRFRCSIPLSFRVHSRRLSKKRSRRIEGALDEKDCSNVSRRLGGVAQRYSSDCDCSHHTRKGGRDGGVIVMVSRISGLRLLWRWRRRVETKIWGGALGPSRQRSCQPGPR